MESIPGILETGWEPPAQDRSRSTRNSDDKADQVDSGFSSDGSGNLRARLTEGAVVVVTVVGEHSWPGFYSYSRSTCPT